MAKYSMIKEDEEKKAKAAEAEGGKIKVGSSVSSDVLEHARSITGAKAKNLAAHTPDIHPNTNTNIKKTASGDEYFDAPGMQNLGPKAAKYVQNVALAGDKKAQSVFANQYETVSTAMNAFGGMIDVNGKRVNMNTADLPTIIQSIRAEPNATRRKAYADAFKTLTKTAGSRFYGVSFDETNAKTFLNSAALSEDDYKDIVEEFESMFNPQAGNEEQNIASYAAAMEEIEAGGYDAYVKKAYVDALNDAYRSQLATDTLPDLTGYTPPQEAVEAPQKAAQEDKTDWLSKAIEWGKEALDGFRENKAILTAGEFQFAKHAEKPEEVKTGEWQGPKQRKAPTLQEALADEQYKQAEKTAEKEESGKSIGEWQGAAQQEKPKAPALQEALADEAYMRAFIEKKTGEMEAAGESFAELQGPQFKSLFERSLEDGEYQAFVEEKLAQAEAPKEVQGPPQAPMLGAQEDNQVPKLIDTIYEKYGAPDAARGMGGSVQGSGTVDLTDDLGRAWFEYKEKGRFNELTPQTQKMLTDLSGEDGVKAWMGILGDDMFARFAATNEDGTTRQELNNEPAEFLYTENMGKLGPQMMKFAEMIYDEAFPDELRYSAFMAGVQLIQEANDWAASERFSEDMLAEHGRAYTTDMVNVYEEYIRIHGQESNAARALSLAISYAEETKKKEAEAQMLAAENEARSAAQNLQIAREAVRSGMYTPEQMALVQENAPVMNRAAMKTDPMYRELMQQIEDEWNSDTTDSWMDEQVLAMAEVLGGEYTAERADWASREVAHIFLEDVLRQKMDVAYSLGYDLSEYAQRYGGITLDSLHTEARMQMLRLGGSVDAVDLAIMEETNRYTGTGEGVSAGDIVGAAAGHGVTGALADPLEAFYTWMAGNDLRRDSARVKATYDKDYGLFSETQLTHDLRAMAQGGYFPSEEMAQYVSEYLDAGGNPYELGLMPDDLQFVRKSAVALKQTQQAYARWAERMLNEKQGMAFEIGSAITDNTTRMVLSSVVRGMSGSAFVGTMVGFGSGSFNEGASAVYGRDAQMIRESGRLPKTNTQRWANIAGVAQSMATSVSEYVTFGKWSDNVGRLLGVNSAVRSGMGEIGTAGAMRLWSGAAKFSKSFAKQEFDEVFLDEMKEGILGAGAEQITGRMRALEEENALSPTTAIAATLESIVSTAQKSDDILKSVLENSGMMALTVAPMALLGAGGEMRAAMPRSYRAAKNAAGSGKAEDMGRFIDALINETANAAPEQIAAADKAMRDVHVAEEAAVILTSDPELEQTNATAAKAQEQADAHGAEAKASEKRMDAAQAAYYERKGAGDIDGANRALANFAKAKQGFNEHEREAEQKQAEADKAFSEGVQTAVTKAEAAVRQQEAAAQASVGTQGRREQIQQRIEEISDEFNAMLEQNPDAAVSPEMEAELEALYAEQIELEDSLTPEIDEVAVTGQRAEAEKALAQKEAEQSAQEAEYQQKVMAQMEADEMKPVYQTLSRTQVYVDETQKANILARTGLKNLGQVNRKFGLRLTSDKTKGATSLDGSFFEELTELAPGRIPQDVTVSEDALMDIVERKKQLKGMQASVGETAYEQYLPDGAFYAIKDPVMQQLTSDVSKATGVEIVVAPLANNIRAIYDRAEKRIIISNRIGAGEISRKVVMHELTHYIEGSAGYDAYKEAVLNAAYLTDEDGSRRAEDENRIRQTYAESGVALDEAGVESELVAEATEKIIADSDGRLTRQLLSQQHRGLLFTLRNKIGQFLARKKAKKEGRLEAYEAIQTAYGRLTQALRQGAGDGMNADPTVDLDAAARRRGDVAAEGADGQMQFALVNPGSHYDYSKPFTHQVDDWLAGKIPKGDTLLVSGTPDVLQRIGFSKLPLTIDQKHMRYVLGKPKNADHDLGVEFMKALPEMIADPIAIIENSGALDNSVIVIFADKNKNADGRPIIGAVNVQAGGSFNGISVDATRLMTVHSRGDLTQRIEQAAEKERNGEVGVYYVNKKTIPTLEPGQSQVLDTLDRYGFIHSILDDDSPVNYQHQEQTQTPQFRRWFGESKIVYDDGMPKVMYRGGNEDIDVFDRRKSSHANLYGRGFYFTEDESQARVYGDTQSYYLSVQHPLSATNGVNAITRTQMRAFLEAVAQDEDYGLDNYGYGATVDSVLRLLKGKNDFDALQDINATAIGDFVAAIELFNKVNGTKYDGIITPTETVVFDSTQIKSADKNVGLFDPKNPNVKYSLAPNQFGNKTAQGLETIDAAVKEILAGSAHEVIGEQERLDTAWQAVNDRGVETVVDELLSRPADSWGAQENVNAALCAVLASRDGNMTTAAAILMRYDREGSKQGQALQARQLIGKLTPEGAIMEMTRKAEKSNKKKGIPPGSFPTGEGAPKKGGNKTREDGSVERIVPAVQEVYHAADELKAMLDTLPGNVSAGNPWGLPLSDKQMQMIRRFKLLGEKLPGINYNVATVKQRMLAAIIASDPAMQGDGLTALCQQLEAMKAGYAVVTVADLNYTASQMAEFRAKEGPDALVPRTQEGREALGRAYQAQDNVVQADFMKKWNSFRFANMLSAPATAARNIAGNVISGGMEGMATRVAEGLDKRISKRTGSRTTAVASKAERKAANAAFASEIARTASDYFIAKVDTGHGRKYDVGGTGRVFQNEFLETYRNMVDFAMQIGDRPFYEQKYAEELAIIKRLGMKKTEMQDGKMISRDMTAEEVHEEATMRALHRVFQEDNAVVNALNGLKAKHPLADLAISVLMPFTKTPTNVAMRAIEYSPVGLAITMARKAAFGMDSGKENSISQRDYVMGIGRGLTGTGLAFAGAALAAAGMIKAGREEEDNASVREVKKALGEPYGMYLQIGDTMREIDWAMPVASAIAIGADFYSALEDGEGFGDAAINAILGSVGGQILDTPMLSAMNDIFRGYDDAENIGSRLVKTGATSLVNQTFSPSIIRAIAKATDPYVRDTSARSGLMSALNSSVIQYWPGLRQMLPRATDMTGDYALQGGYYSWGKENQNVALHFLDSFFTPTATIGEKNDDALYELLDLSYRTGETSFLPKDMVGDDGEAYVLQELAKATKTGESGYTLTLDDDERREFNRLYGDIIFNGLRGVKYEKPKGIGSYRSDDLPGIRNLMQSREWERMSDEERVKKVEAIKKTVRELVTYRAIKGEL